MIWLLLQALLLSQNVRHYGDPAFELLQGAGLVFCLAWLLKGVSSNLHAALRYAFSAYLGALAAWILASPLAVIQRVWPTLWLRLSDLKLDAKWRLWLVFLQLALVGLCPKLTAAWLFCRLCAGLGCLAQLKPGSRARVAGTAILCSGLGPALTFFWETSPDPLWPPELAATALMLFPQIWLRQEEDSQ